MHPCKHYKTNNMHPFIIISFLPRQDLALLSYKRSDMAQFIVYRLNHNKHITKIYINYVRGITMAKQLHVMNNKLFWHFLVIQD